MTAKQLGSILSYFAKINPRFAPDFGDFEILGFWHEQFKDISPDLLKSILKDLIEKSEYFPSLAQVRRGAGKVNRSDEYLAREAASLIIQAVKKYGSINNDDRIELFVGELAWAVIERRGGWLSICDSMPSNQTIPTVEAQLRELCKSELELHRLGLVETKPALPRPHHNLSLPESPQ